MAGKKIPSIAIMEMLSKKWSLLVLRSINLNSKRRFNELIKDLRGISPKTLSERLKELEKFEAIRKRAFAEIPPRVEYSLTPKGKDLINCFRNIDNFVKKWGK